jgi:DNA-binding NarL/FixJ family response regulator
MFFELRFVNRGEESAVTIRILLADYHASMRESLRALIDRQPGMEVVGEAETGPSMLQLTGSFKPDVVVMDINIPDLNGIDAARQMISGSPEVKLLVLSMYSNPEFVDGMLKAGACGYLLKEDAFEELVLAIQTVVQGRIYLCPGIENPAAPESG